MNSEDVYDLFYEFMGINIGTERYEFMKELIKDGYIGDFEMYQWKINNIKLLNEAIINVYRGYYGQKH